MPDATHNGQSRHYVRTCIFCGKDAIVTLPEGATDLDVDAEFSSQGREFAEYEDGDPIGVGCYRCSSARWKDGA